MFGKPAGSPLFSQRAEFGSVNNRDSPFRFNRVKRARNAIWVGIGGQVRVGRFDSFVAGFNSCLLTPELTLKKTKTLQKRFCEKLDQTPPNWQRPVETQAWTLQHCCRN